VIRRLALAFLLSVGTPAFSATDSPAPSQASSGPISPAEADLLWNRAQEEIQKKQWDAAIHTLSRLVDRIPTHAHSLEAQRLLGEVELEVGHPERALDYFNLYSNNLGGKGKAAREADLMRGWAYLQLNKPTQALLLAEKLVQEADRGNLSWGLDAQILHTRALLGLRQLSRAKNSLEAARKRPRDGTLQPKNAALWLEVLELQTQELACARYPSAKKLREDQVLDQMRRKVQCVQGAQTQFAKVRDLTASEALGGNEAKRQAEQSWNGIRSHLKKNCNNPPLPIEKRSPQELQIYLQELQTALREVCSKAEPS